VGDEAHDESAALARASLLAEGLSEDEVDAFLAGVPKSRTPWLRIAALAIALLLLIVLPLAGAVVGACQAWEPVTDAHCGLWIFPALINAGVGGLVGLAVGWSLGVVAVYFAWMWLADAAR
jgi:hypothetical protein